MQVIAFDTRNPAERHALAMGIWDCQFERAAGSALRRVASRLAAHRKVQAQVARGEKLTGYYQSAAHSRAEVIEAVHMARARRDDFLRRWPMPVAPAASSRKAA